MIGNNELERIWSERCKWWRQNYPYNRPWRPIGLWDVEAVIFCGQQAHKWWWGQPYSPAALYPQEDSWYSYLLHAESTLRVIVCLEGLSQSKNSVTSWGIETATFRLVVKCLNKHNLRYYVNINLEESVLSEIRNWHFPNKARCHLK
jgi:hypothetical protein